MALNRREAFLAAIAGDDVNLKPLNRREAALAEIAISKTPIERLPEGYPYEERKFYYDNSGYKDGDDLIGDFFYKVSDDVIPYEDIIGAELGYNGTKLVVDESLVRYVEGEYCCLGEAAFVAYEDNVIVNFYDREFNVPTAGLYMPPDKLTNGSTSITKTTIVPMAEKFLPPGIGGGSASWNDLTDKPFYVFVKKGESILEKGEYSDGGTISLGTGIWSELRKCVVVEIDGVPYETKQESGDGYSIQPFDDTVDVFRFYTYSSSATDLDIYFEGGGNHTVEIYYGTVAVKPIDMKYLPKSLQFGDKRGHGARVTKAEYAHGAQLDYYEATTRGRVIVYFDEIEYLCEPYNESLGDGMFTAYIGNGSILNDSLEDNGLPFAVGCYRDYFAGAIYFYDEGTHTIEIVDAEVDTIDPYYLPKADTVANAAGETVTGAEFNALLTSLRKAGYLES